jgi:hypothetical protein
MSKGVGVLKRKGREERGCFVVKRLAERVRKYQVPAD